MRIHELKSKRKKKKHVRSGRGIGSGRGAKSGKGQKGQNSRSGGHVRLGFEGGRTPTALLFPKKRGTGYKNSRPRVRRFFAETVTLESIEKAFSKDELVTPRSLARRGLIKTARGGAKVVARGELKKKLRFKEMLASAASIKAIESAGGKFSKIGKKARIEDKKKAEANPQK